MRSWISTRLFLIADEYNWWATTLGLFSEDVGDYFAISTNSTKSYSPRPIIVSSSLWMPFLSTTEPWRSISKLMEVQGSFSCLPRHLHRTRPGFINAHARSSTTPQSYSLNSLPCCTSDDDLTIRNFVNNIMTSNGGQLLNQSKYSINQLNIESNFVKLRLTTNKWNMV